MVLHIFAFKSFFMEYTPQNIYQQSQQKTRVVILAPKVENNLTAMLLHVLEYHGKNVDFVLDKAQSTHFDEQNEFIVIESAISADIYKANIALLCDINPEINTATFIKSLINGGMLVYNEEVATLKSIVEASTSPIKKYPYQAPNFTLENETVVLDTNEGKLPLEMTNENDIKHILGVKWICQHMGVDEDDFFEAVGTFPS